MNRFAVVFIFTLYLTLDICKSTGTQCDSNCIECDNSGTSGSCIKCNDGFYPNQFNCQPCTYPNCKTCSNPSYCDLCKDGFWGVTCIATCAEGCVDKKCNTTNGFCSCRMNFFGNKCDGKCSDNCVPSTCFSDSEGHNQQTEEITSSSVIGGAVGGVLGVKEKKKTYEDISPGKSKDEPYTTLAVASTTEYEIPDSEPRSELTIEGEDNRVYYNDEGAYYKNVGEKCS
ncbi:hypothetical protein MAR_030646 [Mya arenaria]|uniref:EGF-like domain-containing protein n=1 Tax=Mya arenaria TaxID=6604 RepID=A0ABY7F346_MYAAR|nr:hypothetical protein MAR_030646 [Mya arenaria]